MPTEPLKVYTLGRSGVIVDLNPLSPDLPDDALQNAQNAVHDPTAAHGGALRKRPGFGRFNQTYAGGSILGGIMVPVAGLGGAPQPSLYTGPTGDPSGGGDGTGAPGAYTSGSSRSYPVPALGATLFNGGSRIFSGARLIIVGRDDNTHGNTGGVGWYVSSKSLADVGTLVTTPGPPESSFGYPPTTLFPAVLGTPFAIYPTTGYVYYALSHDQLVGGVGQTIRKTNGATDVVSCVAPSGNPEPTAWQVNPPGTAAVRASILTMHVGADGYIYIGQKLHPSGQTTAVNAGRILKLNPATNVISVVNTDASPTGDTSNVYISGLPLAIAHFGNSVYWGEFNLTTSELKQDTVTTISGTTTDQSYSVADVSLSQGEGVTWMYPFPQTAPASAPTMDVFANRVLFAGLATNKATPAFAYIMMRARGAVGTIGLWSAVEQGSGGAVANANYFVSAVAFGDNLYASFYNPGTAAKIFKFVPDYTHLALDGFWNGDGTWSTVFTNSGASDRVPYMLYVDDGVMYAIGTLGLGAGRHHMVSTTGTAWTDVTSSLPNTPGNTYTLPILFGLAQ